VATPLKSPLTAVTLAINTVRRLMIKGCED